MFAFAENRSSDCHNKQGHIVLLLLANRHQGFTYVQRFGTYKFTCFDDCGMLIAVETAVIKNFRQCRCLCSHQKRHFKCSKFAILNRCQFAAGPLSPKLSSDRIHDKTRCQTTQILGYIFS